MSNRYKKAVIDDVIGEGIEAEQQSQLLDLFESAMKSIAVTLAREATFHTSDFATAKQRGCEGFQLRLDRLPVDGQTMWRGEFSKGDQRLSVIGSLE